MTLNHEYYEDYYNTINKIILIYYRADVIINNTKNKVTQTSPILYFKPDEAFGMSALSSLVL